MIKRLLITMMMLGSYLVAGNVSGYVADAESGETVIGVNVIVVGTNRGAVSDVNGFFLIRNLPAGTINLRFAHISFADTVVTFDLGNDDLFLGHVQLRPAALEMEAIEVRGKRGDIIKKDMDIASFQASPTVLKEVPQLGKDVFQLIKYSPSVSIGDALSPLYYVRGGDSGENLVQLDGMTIYNPSHPMSGAAIFNPYAIKNIEMLVGGFDAEYGGRNSSILRITSREGHKEEVQGEFRPSISGLVGAVEFPAFGNGTAMVSGRLRTDIVSRVMLGMPNLLADFNGAYLVNMGRTRLRLSGFYARDYLDYDIARFMLYIPIEELEGYHAGFVMSSANDAVGLQVRSILTPNLILNGHLYHSGFSVNNRNFFSFSFNTDTASSVDASINYETRVVNQVSEITGKFDLAYFTFLNQTFKLGGEQTYYRFLNETGMLAYSTSSNTIRPMMQQYFLQDKIEAGPLLLKAGVRAARLEPENVWRYQPRASAAFIAPKFTVKVAWGIYHQYIATMNTQDQELIQFIDYYYPLRNMEPLVSEHFVVGLETKLTDEIDLTATVFYKDLKNLYRLDYFTALETIYSYGAELEKGDGEAYGFELLARGEMETFSGWVSYTYSRSMRSFPSFQNGDPYAADGDQPHSFKAVLMYKLNADITASTTMQLTSGYPKTWETGWVNYYSYDAGANKLGVFGTHYSPVKNNKRFPPRFILDFGWKKKLRSGFGYRLGEYLGADDVYLTTSLRNLAFLVRNPFQYVYIPNIGYYGMGMGGFTPSVSAGYMIKF